MNIVSCMNAIEKYKAGEYFDPALPDRRFNAAQAIMHALPLFESLNARAVYNTRHVRIVSMLSKSDTCKMLNAIVGERASNKNFIAYRVVEVTPDAALAASAGGEIVANIIFLNSDGGEDEREFSRLMLTFKAQV